MQRIETEKVNRFTIKLNKHIFYVIRKEISLLTFTKKTFQAHYFLLTKC